MKKIPLYLSFLFVVYTYISCTSESKKVNITVDIPIEDDMIIHVFNLSNGTQVYEDTLWNKLTLDSPSFGIHLLTILWDRDIISPDEFKSLRSHTLDNPSYYSLQKLVFINPKDGANIRLYVPEEMTRESMEEQLLSNTPGLALSVEVDERKAQLYEKYNSIRNAFRLQLNTQKDSLKEMLYRYNDEGNIQQASVINLQIKDLWKTTILPQYEEEERRFLLEHADDIIVPFILHQRVINQELYQSFKPVIDAMPENHRKLPFILNLAKLPPEKRGF